MAPDPATHGLEFIDPSPAVYSACPPPDPLHKHHSSRMECSLARHNTQGQRLSAHAPVALQMPHSLPIPCPSPHDTHADPQVSAHRLRYPPLASRHRLDAPLSFCLLGSLPPPFLPPWDIGLQGFVSLSSLPVLSRPLRAPLANLASPPVPSSPSAPTRRPRARALAILSSATPARISRRTCRP